MTFFLQQIVPTLSPGHGGVGDAPTSPAIVTPAPLKDELIEAIDARDTRGAVKLIKGGACLDGKDVDGSTPLMRAIQAGLWHVVKELLQRGVESNGWNEHGMSALLSSCKQGNVSVSLALIKAGADVNARSGQGDTPLLFSCCNGLESVALELIKRGADVNSTNDGDEAPLTLSCSQGLVSVTHALLKAGADINFKNSNGDTPLTLSCWKGLVSVSLALIDRGAEVNARNSGGFTPLHLLGRRSAKVRSALIARCATASTKRIYAYSFAVRPLLVHLPLHLRAAQSAVILQDLSASLTVSKPDCFFYSHILVSIDDSQTTSPPFPSSFFLFVFFCSGAESFNSSGRRKCHHLPSALSWRYTIWQFSLAGDERRQPKKVPACRIGALASLCCYHLYQQHCNSVWTAHKARRRRACPCRRPGAPRKERTSSRRLRRRASSHRWAVIPWAACARACRPCSRCCRRAARTGRPRSWQPCSRRSATTLQSNLPLVTACVVCAVWDSASNRASESPPCAAVGPPCSPHCRGKFSIGGE